MYTVFEALGAAERRITKMYALFVVRYKNQTAKALRNLKARIFQGDH